MNAPEGPPPSSRGDERHQVSILWSTSFSWPWTPQELASFLEELERSLAGVIKSHVYQAFYTGPTHHTNGF